MNNDQVFEDRENLIKCEIRLAALYTSNLGIFIFPDKNDLNTVHGFMKLDECYYPKAIFKFIINFPENFPNSIPIIRFVSEVYHPLVKEEDGIIDADLLFPNWTISKGKQLVDILIKIRGLFYQKELFETENSYNPDASILFKNNLNEFLSKTYEISNKSKEDFGNHYDNCPYAFDEIKKIPEELKNLLSKNYDSKEKKLNEVKKFIINKIRSNK